MKLDIYGRMVIEVTRIRNKWFVYRCGPEGKRSGLDDVAIPATVTENEVVDYLDDFFHEWATPSNPNIRVID